MACRISNGRLCAQHVAAADGPDIPRAIKQVADTLDDALHTRFDAAFVTGNFGEIEHVIARRRKDWGRPHKISDADLAAMASGIQESGRAFMPLHIIPLRYDLDDFPNVSTPVGQTSPNLSAMFGIISANPGGMSRTRECLRAAHIMGREFFDTHYLIAQTARPQKESSLILDLGASQTTTSIWTSRGPMSIKRIPVGMSSITDALARNFGLKWAVAEKIKRDNLALSGGDMDRFTPASKKHDFSRADVNDIAIPILHEIIDKAHDESAAGREKYTPSKIYLCGGGADISGIGDYIRGLFGIDVEVLGPGAGAGACAAHIWTRMKPRAMAIAARNEKRRAGASFIFGVLKKLSAPKRRRRFVPVMPSTLAFNMRDMATYARFRAGGISMIHVDIMDGLYTSKMTGGIEELKIIRKHSDTHLHVHLMTESPLTWAASAAAAGADTVIVSTGTYGVRAALTEIRALGKRAGIAISPDSPLTILKPVLRDIDEVLVMSVAPGAGGQEFMPDAAARIAALAATRKKYKLNFKISVDGGINPETAPQCWAAGADFVVSGNYLARAADFPAAVQDLLPR